MKQKTDRELAMEWWHTFRKEQKQSFCVSHKTGVGENRHFQTLTGREIEMIWKAEGSEMVKG